MKHILLVCMTFALLAVTEAHDGPSFDPLDSVLNRNVTPSELYHLASSQDPYFSSSEADIVREL